MLLSEIRSEFRTRIEDSVFWTDTKADTLANEGLRRIAGEFEIKFQGYAQVKTENDVRQYSAPHNYISNQHMWYNLSYDEDDDEWGGSYNQKIKMLDSQDEIYGVVSDTDTTGQPTHAYMWAVESRRDLFLYPTPDAAYKIEWWFFKTPTKLENDNDEPELPVEMHQYLVDFMELRARQLDKEISLVVFEGLWESKVKKMRKAHSAKEMHRRKSRIPSGKDGFPRTGINTSQGVIGIANSDDGIIWRSVG